MTETPWEPPIAGTEAEQLLAALDRLRATFRYKADGLDAAGLSRRIGSSTLTLGGLLKHLALVEDHQFGAKLTGAPLGAPWSEVDWDAEPDWDFRTAAGDSPRALYALWDAAAARSRERVAKALADGGLDQSVHASIDGKHANLRRLVCDMIEEYGRHTGHADLIREAVDGRTGEDPSPGWKPTSLDRKRSLSATDWTITVVSPNARCRVCPGIMHACIGAPGRRCGRGCRGRLGRQPRPLHCHMGVASVVTVHNFSYGLLNPALGYVMSCVGSFLGLRCVTLARSYDGFARARWLSLAAVSIGATGIWAMHFIAMLGFTIPGQQIGYNVPMTVASMLVAVAVVGAGLFIVGFGSGGVWRLVTGGVIVGVGVAAMHYLGMAAMSMTDSMSYKMPLLVLSVVIAIVAGTAALWAGTRVSGLGATVGAALIMGVAVSGMHYTGMAALQIHRGLMPSMPSMAAVAAATDITTVSGATAAVFLIPLLLVISIGTFAVTLTITMAPGEDEIEADAEMQRRMEYLQHRRDWSQVPTGPAEGWRQVPTGPADDWYESLPDDRF